VIRDELAIEQFIAADAEARDEVGEADLGGIAHPAEHALAEKGAAQRYAVEAADQFPADLARAPHLDRVGMAVAVEDGVGLFDLPVDPRFGAVPRRLGARPHDTGEGAIGGHGEAVRAQGLAQRVGEVEAVQRQDPALLGFHPEDVGGVPAVRHREDADRIGAQQEIGVDRLGGRATPAP